MIPTKEEQENKIQGMLFNNEAFSASIHNQIKNIVKEYAKWYTEKVIDRCAEVAGLDKEVVRNNIQCTNQGSKYIEEHTVIWSIDKQSILNVKEEL